MTVTRLSNDEIDDFCDGSGFGQILKEAMQLPDNECRAVVSGLLADLDTRERDYIESVNWTCTALEKILRNRS